MLNDKSLKEKTEKQLDEMFKFLRESASQKLDSALVSGAISDIFRQEQSYLLAKVVLRESANIFHLHYSKEIQDEIENLSI